jgi:hypothetical protein
VRSSPVVVPGIFGHHAAQVRFAEDQHPVGDLCPGGEYEPLRIGIRARTPRRDLYRFDTSAGQDRVERRAELPGPVTDEEPETGARSISTASLASTGGRPPRRG